MTDTNSNTLIRNGLKIAQEIMRELDAAGIEVYTITASRYDEIRVFLDEPGGIEAAAATLWPDNPPELTPNNLSHSETLYVAREVPLMGVRVSLTGHIAPEPEPAQAVA